MLATLAAAAEGRLSYRLLKFSTIFIAFIALSNILSHKSPLFLQPVSAIAELEDLLLLAMMQNLVSGGGGAAGGAGGNALTGAFSGLGRGMGCNRAGGVARIQDAGPGSMMPNEVGGGGQQLHGGHHGVATEGNARAISVDPNPAPLIKAGEETNSIHSHHHRVFNAAGPGGTAVMTNNNGSAPLTPFLDFEILPGFVINGSSGGAGSSGNGGGSGFNTRQQPISNAPAADSSGSAATDATNSGAEIEQVGQQVSTKTDTVSVTANATVVEVQINDTAAAPATTSSPIRTTKIAIKISAKQKANLVQAPLPGAAATADKNKLTSMFGWDQQQDEQGPAAARRRKRSIQPVYEGQAREGRRGEPSFQRGSKRHQTPGVVSNIGPSTAQLKRTTGRLIESRLETLVDKISAMNAAGGNGGGPQQMMNMPFNPPPGGGGMGGGGTLGGYLHPEGFMGGMPAPQYYGPNAGVAAGEAASRVYAPNAFPRNPFDSPAANQAPWPDSQVAYVQPGQYQSGPQSPQQVLNNFLRFLPRLLEAARKR